jgi:hypothetical protein
MHCSTGEIWQLKVLRARTQELIATIKETADLAGHTSKPIQAMPKLQSLSATLFRLINLTVKESPYLKTGQSKSTSSIMETERLLGQVHRLSNKHRDSLSLKSTHRLLLKSQTTDRRACPRLGFPLKTATSTQLFLAKTSCLRTS